jgi:NMD protein affecting ribosome stability and mRNA decay
MIKQIIDLPDGWTCIECGDEYLQDTEGELVADYTEGTLCKKCNSEDNMIKKKEKWTDEENKLASMLAWMCCHADEDCPSEYRSKHFSSHLDDAVEYLEKSGWYDYNRQARNK